ncbi:hypothetical protein GCM10027519_43220 [Kineococcus endophyticus]
MGASPACRGGISWEKVLAAQRGDGTSGEDITAAQITRGAGVPGLPGLPGLPAHLITSTGNG